MKAVRFGLGILTLLTAVLAAMNPSQCDRYIFGST